MQLNYFYLSRNCFYCSWNKILAIATQNQIFLPGVKINQSQSALQEGREIETGTTWRTQDIIEMSKIQRRSSSGGLKGAEGAPPAVSVNFFKCGRVRVSRKFLQNRCIWCLMSPFCRLLVNIFSNLATTPRNIRYAGVFSSFNIYIERERIFSSSKSRGGVFLVFVFFWKTDANDAFWFHS